MATVIASRGHYAAHMAPIDLDGLDVTLVAAHADLVKARRAGHRRIVLMQHGIGQSYGPDRHPAYPGGEDNEGVGLFLVPGEHPAGRWREAYPAARVEVVGSPRLDELPRREYSIGVECDLWQDLLAAIQIHPRMFGSTADGPVCVGHAITARRPSELESARQRATDPSPNTIGSAIWHEGPNLPPIRPDLVPSLTASIKSATSRCTIERDGSCLVSAISADRPIDWKSLFDGIRLRTIGVSTLETGSHTLQILTTTFGSVSLAMPCTTRKAAIGGQADTRPVCAVSFHWRTGAMPEMRHAFTFYGLAAASLSGEFHVIGHGHPRATRLPRFWAKVGIEYVPDFDEVCRRADVLVFDNTSAGYEFASTGRPVVVLNSPGYRKDVDFGLRFWDAADVGIQVDFPTELAPAVRRALELRPDDVAAREAALDIVYRYRTGAAQRAADTIRDWAA